MSLRIHLVAQTLGTTLTAEITNMGTQVLTLQNLGLRISDNDYSFRHLLPEAIQHRLGPLRTVTYHIPFADLKPLSDLYPTQPEVAFQFWIDALTPDTSQSLRHWSAAWLIERAAPFRSEGTSTLSVRPFPLWSL